MNISVIIPTHNRYLSLKRTLDSLSTQSIAPESFEVIVVDDGSTDKTASVDDITYPFSLRYRYQENQGDAAARNYGALQSGAELLVFIDDDIIVTPDFLLGLNTTHGGDSRRIVMGTQYPVPASRSALAEALYGPENSVSDNTSVVFTELCSNNMALARSAYFEVGMMRSLPFPGSSIWCDTDFAFRAYKKGYSFHRSPEAICYHHDHILNDLSVAIKRSHEVGYRAVYLLREHDELLPFLPMFADKTPVQPQERARLRWRKRLRSVASSKTVLLFLEKMVAFNERHQKTIMLPELYRWIIGGYLFRGYRQGLKDLHGE